MGKGGKATYNGLKAAVQRRTKKRMKEPRRKRQLSTTRPVARRSLDEQLRASAVTDKTPVTGRSQEALATNQW